MRTAIATALIAMIALHGCAKPTIETEGLTWLDMGTVVKTEGVGFGWDRATVIDTTGGNVFIEGNHSVPVGVQVHVSDDDRFTYVKLSGKGHDDVFRMDK